MSVLVEGAGSEEDSFLSVHLIGSWKEEMRGVIAINLVGIRDRKRGVKILTASLG